MPVHPVLPLNRHSCPDGLRGCRGPAPRYALRPGCWNVSKKELNTHENQRGRPVRPEIADSLAAHVEEMKAVTPPASKHTLALALDAASAIP